jgi:Pentapeptide repeats (8 copies)
LNHIATKLCIALTALALSGCGTSTINSALKKGAVPLSVDEIFSLANNNTLRLVSSDFDAHVFLAENGKLTANSLKNSDDSGIWDIKNNANLCLKFDLWYYGDVNCYSVYRETERNSYLLYTTNGAFAYTATMASGNSENLRIAPPRNKDEFIRESLSKGQSNVSRNVQETPVVAAPVITNSGPAASSEEINQTVKSMAQDCPDCNLEDADLRKAYLVGANLKGANLRGADLSRANLRRANLEGADLSGATLLSANLPGANLKDANLKGADLTGSNLIQADFTGAELANSILKDTLQEESKGL